MQKWLQFEVLLCRRAWSDTRSAVQWSWRTAITATITAAFFFLLLYILGGVLQVQENFLPWLSAVGAIPLMAVVTYLWFWFLAPYRLHRETQNIVTHLRAAARTGLADEFWPFELAYEHVVGALGEHKDGDGHYGSDSILQRAFQGDVRIQGRESEPGIVDDLRLNTNVFKPIPSEAWEKIDVTRDHDATRAPDAVRWSTKSRQPKYATEQQYFELRVSSADVRKAWPIIPMWEAVRRVSNVIGDNDEKHCFPAARKAIRQKAHDGLLVIRGRKQMQKEYPTAPTKFTDIQSPIDAAYWTTSILGPLATCQQSTTLGGHTMPENSSAWGPEGLFAPNHYTELQVSLVEFEEIWPIKKA